MSKGELTRQRIVALAAPIFNQRGFNGCSIQDVMEATGLEKGGIYRHFSSKEELAAETFRYSLEQAMDFRTRSLDWSLSPLKLLHQYIDLFVKHPSPVPGGCPLMNTAVDADDGNPVLRRLVREGLTAWKSRLARLVDAAIDGREIRKGTDSTQIATVIIATLEGALMISRIEGTRAAMESARLALETLLDSVACPRKH